MENDSKVEEKEIYISIDVNEIKFGGCQECYEFGGYSYDMMGKNFGELYFESDKECTIENPNHWSKFEYKWKTRKEVEVVAITKAFKLLQEKIDKDDPEKIKERRDWKLSQLLKINKK